MKFNFKSEQDWENTGDEEETLIIRYYSDESKAAIISALLRESGVSNFLSSTLMNQLLPMGQGAIALHVKITDRERALSILSEIESSADDELEDVEVDLETGVVKVRQKRRVDLTPGTMLILFIILLILVLLLHSMIYIENGYRFW